jgi:ribonuclease BN (tRNA processing enzyme)
MMQIAEFFPNLSRIINRLRINGVLPDKRRLGNQEKSERYAEIVESKMETNTSCSIIIKDTKQNTQYAQFHIIFDLGEGVIRRVEKGFSDLGIENYKSESTDDKLRLDSTPALGSPLLLSSLNPKTQNSALQEKKANLFDTVLISHSHEDHIRELPNLILRQSSPADHAGKTKLKVYCTQACKATLP